jgi:hypothetical protein
MYTFPQGVDRIIKLLKHGLPCRFILPNFASLYNLLIHVLIEKRGKYERKISRKTKTTHKESILSSTSKMLSLKSLSVGMIFFVLYVLSYPLYGNL